MTLRGWWPVRLAFVAVAAAVFAVSASAAGQALSPLLSQEEPVDWWFVFKFNAASFPACGSDAQRSCIFGGKVASYAKFSQQFVYASSSDLTLHKGSDCLGDSKRDPVGATFEQIYNGSYFYVIWNDQFYDKPAVTGGSTRGHSKGVLAWDKDGDGLVMQVTTPSWPAAGSADIPRKGEGNTLGCITKPNNVMYSQHFFSMKLDQAGVLTVLAALANASVITDPDNEQIVHNGGPPPIRKAVENLGKKSPSTAFIRKALAPDIDLISKPSNLNVPPWQMISAILGGVPLRAATWWTDPEIPSTKKGKPECWDKSLGTPGPVEIATSGQWAGTKIGLKGGLPPTSNHAKIGVSTDEQHSYAILADMNQQGTLGPDPKGCGRSQNGRGGLFYVIKQPAFTEQLGNLIKGDTAPTDLTDE